MIWARLIAVMLLILGGPVCAQSANEIVSPLKSCLRSSRLADAICMRQDDPAQRLDCLHKVSAAQLECLEHALPKGATASENSSGAVPSGPPNAASSEAPLKGAPPKEQGGTESQEVPTGSILKESDSPSKADVTTNPPPDDHVQGKIADVPALLAQTNWIVKEITSPRYRRTLVRAVIHATPVVKNGPNTLTIGCRGRRTELSIDMEGDFAAPKGAPQINSQINDEPAVRRRWVWSAHRKRATYKDDPVGILQSVPEGATLRIAVSDKESVSREATFQLTGLDLVRKQVATACEQTSKPRLPRSSRSSRTFF